MQAVITIPPESLRVSESLFPPCFAEGSSESDHHSPAYVTPVVRKKMLCSDSFILWGESPSLFPTI